MNPLSLTLVGAALATLPCLAQPTPMSPCKSDPLTEAVNQILATPGGEEKKPDEAPAEAAPTATDPAPSEQPTPPPSEVKPPSDSPPAATNPEVISSPDAPDEPGPGVIVKVEKLQSGNGTIDPKSVKLLAPFPAKPLAPTPPGWRLDSSNNAPPFVRKVDLAPGAGITLTIRPHLLIPDAESLAIAEPGFDAALGYHQTQTVSAILANSIEQLDEDAKQLGNAIDHLQRLVSSLPHPAPKPLPAAPPNPANTR